MKTSREVLEDVMLVKPINIIPVENATEKIHETVSAIASVINYIITDAFTLSSEESFWVGHQLGELLEPLKNYMPTAIMGAVQKEIETRDYSNRMITRATVPSYAIEASYAEHVKYASVSDWTEGICEIILSCYPDLRPMTRSSIIGSVHGLFIELGVSDNLKTSRPSSYLPNSVRYLLASNRSE